MHRLTRLRTAIIAVATSAVALGALVATPVGSPAAASARAGSPDEDTYSFTALDLPPLAVTSSTGRTLALVIGADSFGDNGACSETTADVSVASPDLVRRNHRWALSVSCGDLSLNADGSGTLDVSGAGIDPLGSIEVSFTPTAAPTSYTCSEGTSVRYTEQATGSATFDTGVTGDPRWGTVGSSATVSWPKGSTLSTTTGSGCGGPTSAATLPRCQKSFLTTAATQPPAPAAQISSDRSRYGVPLRVFGSQTVSLTEPAGATRTDIASTTLPVPTVINRTDDPTIELTSDGPGATGGLVIHATGKPVVSYDTCRLHGHHHVQVTRIWFHGTYQNRHLPLTIADKPFPSVELAGHRKQATVIGVTYRP